VQFELRQLIEEDISEAPLQRLLHHTPSPDEKSRPIDFVSRNALSKSQSYSQGFENVPFLRYTVASLSHPDRVQMTISSVRVFGAARVDSTN
jgi:hypothetical protein